MRPPPRPRGRGDQAVVAAGGVRPGPGARQLLLTRGGTSVVEPFEKKVRAGVADKKVTFRFRHRVDEIVTTGGVVTGVVTGVRGAVLEPSGGARGKPSSRTVVSDFELRAPFVVVTSGGIGADHDPVRKNWPARMGSPAEVRGQGSARARRRPHAGHHREGGRAIVNPDPMGHYTEGLRDYDPIWPGHGIRVLPGCGSRRRPPGARWGKEAPCPVCTRPGRSRRLRRRRNHGYRSLEGTFLGGCLFSGRQAGRAAAAATAA
ncbi:FAD-binding protein [Streptomyces sp. NPDC005486]|uniref:FAD-binding protein n=1 Tax=Streptomyces sp. NPDC005486 TaxID=3155345 RepID=UPI0033B033A1